MPNMAAKNERTERESPDKKTGAPGNQTLEATES